jgi:iron(III) transport system substrate-binding protein
MSTEQKWFLLPVLLGAAAQGGCKPDERPAAERSAAPVVYCSVDVEFARMVLARFESQTGVRPEVLTDSEAGKTTGLVNRIVEESAAGRRRADVFWSSELFNTILLARQGLLERYDPASAGDIPERFRDPGRRWTAVSARARVLAFNKNKIAAETIPTRWAELARPEFASRLALANPLFGTTRSHVAAMFAIWGPQRARDYLTELRDHGVVIVDGNSAAVRAVLDGRAVLAATDTDDVWLAQQRDASIDLRYLDMGDGGTLVIPCSVALIAGSDSLDARRLVDFLVSSEVERLLAESSSRNVPVRAALRDELSLEWPPESRIDFEKAAATMDEAVALAREVLLR